MSKGGTQKTTSSTQNEPWGPWADQAKHGLGWMNSISQDPSQQFQGSRVSGRSAMTLDSEQGGMGLLNNSGNPQQMAFLQNLLGGGMLTPEGGNPYIQQIGNMAAADATQDFKRSMIPGASLGGSKAGSGAQTNMNDRAFRQFSDSLNRSRFGLLGNNYNMERGYQQQAPGMMQNAMQSQRQNLGMAHQLGASSDNYGQRQLDDQVNKFNFGENEERNRLDQFLMRLGGMAGNAGQGGTQEQQGTMPGQGGMTAAQGAGLGLGLLSMMTQASSRTLKHGLGHVDSDEALRRVQELTVDRWRYTQEAATQIGASEADHIGPYAEDFQQQFGVGDGMSISIIDMLGVSYAALKGAANRIASLESRLAAVESGGA